MMLQPTLRSIFSEDQEVHEDEQSQSTSSVEHCAAIDGSSEDGEAGGRGEDVTRRSEANLGSARFQAPLGLSKPKSLQAESAFRPGELNIDFIILQSTSLCIHAYGTPFSSLELPRDRPSSKEANLRMSTLSRNLCSTASRSLRQRSALCARAVRPIALRTAPTSARTVVASSFSTMTSLKSAAPPVSGKREYDPEIKDVANYIHNVKIDSELAVWHCPFQLPI